ncbi:MAG: TIGR03936 family radical SAM-associated protein [Lachnospiraceae bacterium]|nr:TIGR03936 family radical SAM-associated protein [Lachnospiraceae bacterium]
MKVRFKFSKHGVLKYIGHLDLMRYFQKAFRRTDIEVLYSKGFSPHMIMSFAQPLGVGVESDGEYFDIEVDDNEDISTMVDKLNDQMAEGIVIHNVVKLPEKFTNAMASVAAADYELNFYQTNPLNKGLLDKYNAADAVTFIKITKTGEHVINVKEFVFDIYLKDDSTLFVKVDASSAGNLKPANLLEALLRLDNIDVKDYPFHILRKDTYMRDPEDNLVPLDKVDYE